MSDHEDRVEERAGIYAQGSCGWQSSFPVLTAMLAAVVRLALQRFLPDSEDAQLRAWDQSIPRIQREVEEILAAQPVAGTYSAILEYELPRERYAEHRAARFELLVSSRDKCLHEFGIAQPRRWFRCGPWYAVTPRSRRTPAGDYGSP